MPSNTEQSSCKPLLFSQSATNRVSFALHASRLVSAMIYHATWNQRDVTWHRSYNLGQYKMEQLSPIPAKAMMKARRSKKRAILASLKWGEGWSRCSIYFVQDCSDQIPHPLWVVIKCAAPGKTKFIKFPPYQAAKDDKCPGGDV